ncbi:MAG: prolyl oligopeptidase family serine peptidase [Chloroflexi bacterium]|nr:prolyl oligopeptidase family serine peptidase [Chloroflexota bacterium]
MKRINKKPVGFTLLVILIVAAGILAYRFDQPGEVLPVFFQASPDWETAVDSPDIQREQVFIQSGKVQLEADLLIPAGGKEKKGAVIFITGSGSNVYQAYFGITQKYVQGVFLPRDMAVLYVNKRGVGESQGNWKHQDFQGRADDLYAAVQFLKEHEAIDPDRIGIMGHSQGGWIVPITASQHEDVAFFISLVGPTTVVCEQMEDDYENVFRCQGYEGAGLEKKVESILKWDRMGAKIGKVIPLGEIGFQAGIFDYDPRQALQTVKSPGLLVFAENDPTVPADLNLARFDEIFNGTPPENLQTVTISGAYHTFHLTNKCLSSLEELISAPLSDELVQVLQDWLTEQGY